MDRPENPPSYESITSPNKPSNASRTDSQHLRVPGNGIPTSSRRSMEDEGRPLPDGWVRQFDSKQRHQFFVDTKAKPPRSIWHHPYDDEQFLSTLDSEERERLQSQKMLNRDAESSADEDDASAKPQPPSPPPRSQQPKASSTKIPAAQEQPHGGLSKFGRKMKDKMTQSTHEEREAERKRRAEEEERAYRAHQAMRQAMSRAVETGQPQLIGKDDKGRDVYIEPPPQGMYAQSGMYPSRGGTYAPQGAYGYNPYTQGAYANPNARFVPYPTPNYPYNRPYGGGFGGGLGLPLMGGLMGGLLLGDLMF